MRKAVTLASAAAIAAGLTIASASMANAAPTITLAYTAPGVISVTGCGTAQQATSFDVTETGFSAVNVKASTSPIAYKLQGQGNVTVVCHLYAGDATATITAGNAIMDGIVYTDTNSNGQMDAGEPVVAGAAATLYDANGKVVGTYTTQADGTVMFGPLIDGAYYLEVQTSNGVLKYDVKVVNGVVTVTAAAAATNNGGTTTTTTTTTTGTQTTTGGTTTTSTSTATQPNLSNTGAAEGDLPFAGLAAVGLAAAGAAVVARRK